jgi:plasmid stability protein
MANTTVMTVRIDNDLLASLKDRAKHLGRSVSAEVIQLIKNQVTPRVQAPEKPFKTAAGMFSQFESLDLEEYQQLSKDYSARINLSL